MPKFNYVVRDKDARLLTGTTEGQDKFIVARELRKKNLTVIEVNPEDKGQKKIFQQKIKGKIKAMDLVVFSRQLATLIDSGVSLVAGLNILHDQVENVFLKKIVFNIQNDIEAGNSLSAAFSKYPEAFPAIFSNMIRAGESSGSLNEILERVADYMEKTEALRRKIKSSLTYPILVVGMALLIVGFLMIKVVPTFKNIFTTLGGQLPTPTQLLISVSNITVKFFPFMIAAVVAICIIFNRYINSPKGRINFDGVKLKLPLFGTIINKIAVSRFTRTLATLVKSGVSILDAFEIAGRVSGNKIIEMATEEIRINMRAGETISDPMGKTGAFPPFVVKMIAVGEQTGELEKMLTKISDYYESQVNDALTELTSLIEPMVITFLGVTIGFIVVAMFLPIFKLTQIVGR